MAHIITSLSIDLKFNVLTTPPAIMVSFTDRDANGQETHGSTQFNDAEAAALLASITSSKNAQGMLNALSAAIDVHAAAVTLPADLAAKVTMASDAEKRARDAQTAIDAANSQLLALNVQIADAKAKIAAPKAT